MQDNNRESIECSPNNDETKRRKCRKLDWKFGPAKNRGFGEWIIAESNRKRDRDHEKIVIDDSTSDEHNSFRHDRNTFVITPETDKTPLKPETVAIDGVESKSTHQKYRTGQSVFYKRKQNPESHDTGDNEAFLEEATIVGVHFDDSLEPYYTIRMTDDGREKQTDDAHLSETDDNLDTDGGCFLETVPSREEIKALENQRQPRSKLYLDSDDEISPKTHFQSECITRQQIHQSNGKQIDILPKLGSNVSSPQLSHRISHSVGDCTVRNQTTISSSTCSHVNGSGRNSCYSPNDNDTNTPRDVDSPPRTSKGITRKLSGIVKDMVHPLTNRFVYHMKHLRQRSSQEITGDEIRHSTPKPSCDSKPPACKNIFNSSFRKPVISVFPPGYDGNDKASIPKSRSDSKQLISEARISVVNEATTSSNVRKLSPLEEWSLRNEKMGDSSGKFRKPGTKLTETRGDIFRNNCGERNAKESTPRRIKLGSYKRLRQYMPCEEMDYVGPPHKRARMASSNYYDSTENDGIFGDRYSSFQNESSQTNMLIKMRNNSPIVAKRQKSKIFSRLPRRRPINIQHYLSKHRRTNQCGLNKLSMIKSQSKGCQTQFIMNEQLSSSDGTLISHSKATDFLSGCTDCHTNSDLNLQLSKGSRAEIFTGESTRRDHDKKSLRPSSDEHKVQSFSATQRTIMYRDENEGKIETEEFFDCASQEVITPQPSTETEGKQPLRKESCLVIDSNETLNYKGELCNKIRAGSEKSNLSKNDFNENTATVAALNGDFAHRSPPFKFMPTGNIFAPSYEHCKGTNFLSPSQNRSFLVTDPNITFSSRRIPHRMPMRTSNHVPHYPWWRNPSLQFPTSNYPRYVSHNNLESSQSSYASKKNAFRQDQVISTYNFMPRKSSSAFIDIDALVQKRDLFLRSTVQNFLSSFAAFLINSMTLLFNWALLTSNSKPEDIITKSRPNDPIAQKQKSNHLHQGTTTSGTSILSRNRPNTSVYDYDHHYSKKVAPTTVPHFPFSTFVATRPYPSAKITKNSGKKNPPPTWTSSTQKKSKVGDWMCIDCGLEYPPSESFCFLCATIGNITIELDEDVVSASIERESRGHDSIEPISISNHYTTTEIDKNNTNEAMDLLGDAPSSTARLHIGSIDHSKSAQFSAMNPNAGSDSTNAICANRGALNVGKKKRSTDDSCYDDVQDHTNKLTRTSPKTREILVVEERSQTVDMETDSISSGSAMSCS
ncbi:hypothetical protein ACHAXS_010056 [Conticribra weissflogii]